MYKRARYGVIKDIAVSRGVPLTARRFVFSTRRLVRTTPGLVKTI